MMPLAARLLPFPRTCKLAGPRGGMVLLLVVALDAAVFCCLFSSSLITKEFGFERAKWWLSIRGYPSLDERDTSYDVRETMTVCCGHVCLAILSNRFVRGKTPGHGTGFDIDEADLSEMWQCQGAVVASAIFACYETEDAIKYSSSIEGSKRAGLWRVVVVCNLPYSDARRNGKVPKLLLHILFPNVQFSILVDGKLKLVRDPYQLFERFLWRKNATFAISRHYRRLDVFEEAEAKKLGGKYDNASIDYQIEFYRREGLTHYSSAKLPIRSDVSEGCVIIREHIAITNLFTCLWFNEVDRFTSRDQLSFSTVRDKIRSRVNWTVDMFLECERRDFVVQPPAVHDQLREMFPNNAANEPEKYSALKKLHSDFCQASKG